MKKKALKITSKLVIFRAFLSFFSSPDPKSEKNAVNQLIKQFWPKSVICYMTSTSNSSQSIVLQISLVSTSGRMEFWSTVLMFPIVLSSRTSDLQFSLVLQTHAFVL